MPVRLHVSAAIPQIDMPTEAIDRLAAHAAESWTLHVCAFAIGRGWRSICGWQSILAGVVELPSPAAGRSAPSCKGSRQPIGADRESYRPLDDGEAGKVVQLSGVRPHVQ